MEAFPLLFQKACVTLVVRLFLENNARVARLMSLETVVCHMLSGFVLAGDQIVARCRKEARLQVRVEVYQGSSATIDIHLIYLYSWRKILDI